MNSKLFAALCCASLLTMAGCGRGEKAAPANEMPQAVGEEIVRDEENANAEPSQPVEPGTENPDESPEIPKPAETPSY